MNNVRLSSFTSLSLKVLGGVLILSTLVDYLLAAFPLTPLQDTWQINFTNQLVSQGTTPMMGMIALILALWVDLNADKKANLKPAITDVRFLSFILSLILGVTFFLLIPLHINNLQQIRDQSISQIDQETQQQEQQVQAQYAQLQALAQSPEAKKQLEQQIKAIDDALAKGQVPPQQIATIEAQKQELINYQRYTNDPNALNTRLEELRSEVAKRRIEQQKIAGNTVIKEAIKIGIRSLLLGLGYIVLGWIGIQTALGANKRPTAPVASTQNMGGNQADDSLDS